eukprot:scaffold343412_cov19-Prasinocladus_malaysianus.AAC.1
MLAKDFVLLGLLNRNVVRHDMTRRLILLLWWHDAPGKESVQMHDESSQPGNREHTACRQQDTTLKRLLRQAPKAGKSHHPASVTFAYSVQHCVNLDESNTMKKLSNVMSMEQ